jgi:hypothetical protein
VSQTKAAPASFIDSRTSTPHLVSLPLDVHRLPHISAGQRQNGQVVDATVDLYGSEGSGRFPTAAMVLQSLPPMAAVLTAAAEAMQAMGTRPSRSLSLYLHLPLRLCDLRLARLGEAQDNNESHHAQQDGQPLRGLLPPLAFADVDADERVVSLISRGLCKTFLEEVKSDCGSER